MIRSTTHSERAGLAISFLEPFSHVYARSAVLPGLLPLL